MTQGSDLTHILIPHTAKHFQQKDTHHVLLLMSTSQKTLFTTILKPLNTLIIVFFTRGKDIIVNPEQCWG